MLEMFTRAQYVRLDFRQVIVLLYILFYMYIRSTSKTDTDKSLKSYQFLSNNFIHVPAILTLRYIL